MINIGTYSTLKIARRMDQGFYLEDEEGDEVLLPNRYITEEMSISDSINVFVYNDSEDRIVATTEQPYITKDEFASLKIKEVTSIGAFADMGLEKDLLIPFNNQTHLMVQGSSYIIYAYLDETTERLVGTDKIYKYLSLRPDELQENEEVDVLVGDKTDIGFFSIVNQRYHGMLFFNELFKEVKTGDKLKAFIKFKRPDGKLDLTLDKPGYEKVEPKADSILEKLKSSNGSLPFTDKSDPEEIKRFFGMSKKTFKKAIGALYKQQLIDLKEDGIYLKK